MLRDLDHRLEQAPPVVVFQMGKVASSTIYESLLRDWPGVVAHAHEFKPDHWDPLIARLAADFRSGARPYRFISLVREPIERNISDFFENYERYVGVPFARDRDRSVAELRQLFLDREPHNFPAEWFDRCLHPSIGIDVYSGPFPPEGFARYRSGNAELLVLRSELPDEAKAWAVAAFTGLSSLRLRVQNRARDKRYAGVYRDFVETVRFPEEFVAGMCATRYYETFYGADHRDRALHRWSASVRA